MEMRGSGARIEDEAVVVQGKEEAGGRQPIRKGAKGKSRRTMPKTCCLAWMRKMCGR